jgi:hypothetical protein
MIYELWYVCVRVNLLCASCVPVCIYVLVLCDITTLTVEVY